MNNFLYKLRLVFQDKRLRTSLLITVGLLLIFRVLAMIPLPGVDQVALFQLFSSNEFLGLLNVFTGGGLSQVSIVALGVGPYITGSIIMQLMTVLIPRFKEMYQEEGEIGRRKFTQYGRMLTVPLAAIQSFSIIKLLESQKVLAPLGGFEMLTTVAVLIGGSMLLMWIGELITEYGIGNGVSLLIFAGIVSILPQSLSQLSATFEPSQIPLYIVFALVSIIVIGLVVFITEAERPIPVTYAKQVRGMKVYGGQSTYLPLRINQSGVMPIIFASSILYLPQIIAQFLVNFDQPMIQSVARTTLSILSNSWVYGGGYFLLVFLFTYFYTAVTFDPDQISKNLQKNGAFIPGVRPGHSTADYVSKVLTRITLVGALFLGLIALLPLIVRGVTGITAISVGGTALLIVVSVVIELIRKIDAQVSIREY